MPPARELATRVGITIILLALLALALATAKDDWDFGPAFRHRSLYLRGLGMAASATGVAYVVGFVLGIGVALARLSRRVAVRHLGDLYVELIRGTPFLAQLFIAYFGIAPLIGVDNKFFVGTLALGVFAAAYIGEIFRAGIESVDRGQFEAARSLGLSRRQTLRHVIFPQAFKRMIPPLTGELIALTKESSLLFAIGLGEMMYAARSVAAATYSPFEAYLVVAAMYLTLTVPLSFLARRLERRMGRSTRLGIHI
jgi:polar amino acid transport system permease protein